MTAPPVRDASSPALPPQLRVRRRNRLIAAVSILLAWGVGVGMLVDREYFREKSAVLAEAAMRLGPSTSFYMVEQDGKQIGFASTTIDTSTTTFEVVDYFIADLPLGDQIFRATARSVITLSRALALQSFDVQFESADAPMSVTGQAEGDSVVSFILQLPAQPPDSQRIRVGGPILLPTLIPAAALLVSDPKVGSSVTLASFDPRTMTTQNVKLRFEAESLFTLVDSARYDSTLMAFVPALTDTVRAWKLVPEDAGGFTGWVDSQGRVVETTQPGGIKLRRMAYEIAFENWRRTRGAATATNVPAGGILEGTAIAAGALPGRDGPSRLRVRLSGVSLNGFDLQGGRQQLAGNDLTIERESAAALTADWSLATRSAGFRQRFEPELRAEPLLQVENTEIIRLATRIAGADRDPRVVAEKLNRWVYDSLEKAITVSIPNALQVLRTRRGDCNEHTQLYTALARALGIPTRIATGVAYVDGKFYYHAWPEVRLGDWVAVDPTFGQFPADAAHLRFVRGGLTRQGELLRLVGNLRIEVLDAR